MNLKCPDPLSFELKGPESPFLKLKGPFTRLRGQCPSRSKFVPQSLEFIEAPSL